MSLITACPACQTQFEVNDEQLQAYAGKVRCGECNHVFDARLSLGEAESAESIVNPIPKGVEPDAPAVTADLTVTLDNTTEELESGLEPADAESEEIEFHEKSSGKAEQTPPLSWDIRPEPVHDTAIPEFLRNVSWEDDRPTLPEKTSVRWVFPLLSSLLFVVILLQLVYFTRTSLAANYPQTRPLLLSACKVAHCAVALPNDITQLTIDDADIQEHREREGVLVFSSVLINHSAVAQAYPKIELTLTNMADEPVLRKILRPQEYLPAFSNATAGLAAQQEQPVRTSLGVEDKAVTGFRVAIAY